MKLHIGNIAPAVTDAELTTVVSEFGETKSVEIVRDRDGASKGFGFADFNTDEHGQAAIAALDGKEVGGQALKVSVAKPRKNDRPAPAQA